MWRSGGAARCEGPSSRRAAAVAAERGTLVRGTWTPSESCVASDASQVVPSRRGTALVQRALCDTSIVKAQELCWFLPKRCSYGTNLLSAPSHICCGFFRLSPKQIRSLGIDFF